MFVYISRKHRRALQDCIAEQFGSEDLPHGSRATLRAALDYLRGCIDESRCTCGEDAAACWCADFIDAELASADDFVARLLAASGGPRWQPRLWRPRFTVTFAGGPLDGTSRRTPRGGWVCLDERGRPTSITDADHYRLIHEAGPSQAHYGWDSEDSHDEGPLCPCLFSGQPERR